MRFPGLLLALLLACNCSRADDTDPSAASTSPWSIESWSIRTSLYTWHWNPSPDHNNRQHLIGLEARVRNRWIFGAAVFDNSFGQSSQFVYTGKYWPVAHSDHWYLKLMAGLLHGYDGEYQDKIPLNGLGVAPGLLPALGFRMRRLEAEVIFAGTAAVTVTLGVEF